jgi:hypothetical protein
MIIALLVLPPASPLLPPPLPRVSTATTKIPHTIEEEEALALLRYSARAREESAAQCVRQRARARRERERERERETMMMAEGFETPTGANSGLQFGLSANE